MGAEDVSSVSKRRRPSTVCRRPHSLPFQETTTGTLSLLFPLSRLPLAPDVPRAIRANTSRFCTTFQHDLREEARARSVERANTVRERGEGAAAVLRSEEALRDAAREEDQAAGPWGFEKAPGGWEEEKGGEQAASGSEQKKKRVFVTERRAAGDDVEESDSGGKKGGKCGRVLRQGMAGVRDGLGVFEIDVADGEFHGFNGGGNIDGVDNSEVQLFQPLQHAAHEER